MNMPVGTLMMIDADGNEQKLGDCYGEIEITPGIHTEKAEIKKECSFSLKVKTSPELKVMFKKAKLIYKIRELNHIMRRTRKVRTKRKLLYRILELKNRR